jgi:hypothetical protein
VPETRNLIKIKLLALPACSLASWLKEKGHLKMPEYKTEPVFPENFFRREPGQRKNCQEKILKEKRGTDKEYLLRS